jgi:hypothetical protein
MENTVAGIMTTPVCEVENEMRQLVGDYTQKGIVGINDIVDFHYRFERIHPFQDGNGRVGRLIMFKECLKNNIVPFVIHDENKKYYYQGISEYGNTQQHLREICLHEQDRCSAVMDYFKVNYAKSQELNGTETPSSKQVMERLFTDITNKCKELGPRSDKNKNDDYLASYYNEIQKAAERIYHFMNNGEIDKNYRDAITELAAICKMDEKELKGKDDPSGKGIMRALLDLEIGFDNALRLMSGNHDGTLFAGISI